MPKGTASPASFRIQSSPALSEVPGGCCLPFQVWFEPVNQARPNPEPKLCSANTATKKAVALHWVT